MYLKSEILKKKNVEENQANSINPVDIVELMDQTWTLKKGTIFFSVKEEQIRHTPRDPIKYFETVHINGTS